MPSELWKGVFIGFMLCLSMEGAALIVGIVLASVKTPEEKQEIKPMYIRRVYRFTSPER